MQTFKGFEPTDGRRYTVPAAFFARLLPLIDDLDELKLTLYCMWALQQREGDAPYLLLPDFTGETATMHGLSGEALTAALARAVARGTLLCVSVPLGERHEPLYFANSPAGRSAVARIQAGDWLPIGEGDQPVKILPERPSVYQLYEENIGALTPLIADELKDLSAEHGSAAVAEAIQVSVRAEKRSLNYIRAVLARWHKDGKATPGHVKGKDHETAGRDTEPNQRPLSGKYADFFER